MKKLLLPIIALALFSCKKNADNSDKELADTLAKIDSINDERTKINDSIQALNEKNRFSDLAGNHQFSYDSDGTKMSGTVNMTKTGRDLYQVRGSASSGSNSLNIDGTIRRVSDKHLNFEGKISQKVNGSAYSRTKKTTFLDEGKGNFWRLQDKVNGDGFVDYIDIHK